MDISVIFLTRKRVESLRKALDSLVNTADDMSSVEILVRFDDDDLETLAIQDNLLSKYSISLIVGPRLGGYKSVHVFMNDLCNISMGKIILCFSDDFTMESKGWDTILRKYLNRFCILNIHSNHVTGSVTTCGFHRRLFELLGHYSLSPHSDTWLEFIGREVGGIEISVNDIYICHHRLDLTGENDDITAKEVRNALKETASGFYTEEMKKGRSTDVAILKDYIFKYGLEVKE